MVKRLFALTLVILAVFLPTWPIAAQEDPSWDESSGEEAQYDYNAQLDALGRGELMDTVPPEAKELMEETGVYYLSIENLLHLSPREFFRTLWNAFVRQLKQPMVTFASICGIILLCAFLNGIQNAAWSGEAAQVFGIVSVLCIVLSVAKPILDSISEAGQAIREASVFMTTFVPVFSAALIASGQPVTGATYNIFLFSASQMIAQVAAQTLVPILSIYLALCIAGAMSPGINISSATATVKTVVGWALGLMVTLFVGLLSVQTMVTTGADSVTTKTAKFLLGSFVPVIGGVLSDALLAAQGCLRLIKTSVGAYGIIVAVFTFLPILLKAMTWYMVANLSVVVSDVVGVPAVSAVLKACATVLGILIAIILCYALLLIVSTTVVMVTGMAG